MYGLLTCVFSRGGGALTGQRTPGRSCCSACTPSPCEHLVGAIARVGEEPKGEVLGRVLDRGTDLLAECERTCWAVQPLPTTSFGPGTLSDREYSAGCEDEAAVNGELAGPERQMSSGAADRGVGFDPVPGVGAAGEVGGQGDRDQPCVGAERALSGVSHDRVGVTRVLVDGPRPATQ